MNPTSRVIDAQPHQVWNVLCDGWLYPLWVVGAARMRDVDQSWPEVGSRLHHSAGSWPLLLDDITVVLEADPLRRLVLRARGWPAGEARVVITLEGHQGRTEVVIEEDASGGPATLVPAPLRRALIRWRNVEALRRLALLVEGRTQ